MGKVFKHLADTITASFAGDAHFFLQLDHHGQYIPGTRIPYGGSGVIVEDCYQLVLVDERWNLIYVLYDPRTFFGAKPGGTVDWSDARIEMALD